MFQPDPAAEFWPRVEKAIEAAGVSRAAVEYEWPECHAKKCGRHHGSPDTAMRMMKASIAEAVMLEMRFRVTTEPDD